MGMLLILNNRSRWPMVVKAFVGLTAAASLSYVVTLAIWLIAGVGAGQIGTIPGGYGLDIPLYFPFTPTMSTQQVLGIVVPRFTGFGREPGWMAMYAGVGFLLYPLTGWKRPAIRWSMLVSLLGTLSTAGFGVFAVAIALDIFAVSGLRPGISRVARRAAGLVLLGIGVWAAMLAPVLGLTAKGAQNAVSLAERTAATELGLQALLSDPFAGGTGYGDIPNVNLIARRAARRPLRRRRSRGGAVCLHRAPQQG